MTEKKPPSRSCLSRQICGGEDWSSIESDDDKSDAVLQKLREHLKLLLTSHRVVVLAGSGTSLGENGPSMKKLWLSVAALPDFAEIKALVKYAPDEDIESFLSQCHNAGPYLAETEKKKVETFVTDAERVIYTECSGFLSDTQRLSNHENLLRKLTRRRGNLPRPMVITTNYDRCFEFAASYLGLTVVDGFSYSQPRFFDPAYFSFDFVRKAHHGKEVNELVDGVIHLMKIHGSVDWEIEGERVKQSLSPADGKRCLIYPASTKYQHSYRQPYLEIMSRYLTALREPQTALIIVGFGFNDDHLSAPILSAIRSNHSLNVIAIAPDTEINEELGFLNRGWEQLAAAARQSQNRVTLLNSDFSQFVELVPDLRALTPDQNLLSALARFNEK
jgi:hypothetical protein